MIYELDHLLDDRNRSLYTYVSNHVPITLEDAPLGQSWGALYTRQTNTANVRCAKSSIPQSAFTHELLHIKFEFEGFVRPDFGIPPYKQNAQYAKWVNEFLVYCYNQLMHLKMAPEFTALGFPVGEFLEIENGRIDRMNDLVTTLWSKRSNRGSEFIEFFIRTYLAMTNPTPDASQQKDWLASMRQIDRNLFGVLEDFRSSWQKSESKDLSWYLARLFYLCGHYEVAVGYDATSMVRAGDCKTQI